MFCWSPTCVSVLSPFMCTGFIDFIDCIILFIYSAIAANVLLNLFLLLLILYEKLLHSHCAGASEFIRWLIYWVCYCTQVFDIVLNGQITVIDGLDIFAKVGRGVAHDEIIPFGVHNGQLQYGTETAPFTGKLIIEFVKVTLVVSFFLSFFSLEPFGKVPYCITAADVFRD